MLNIVIPMAGKSTHFADEQFRFPKSLVEVCGKPMIEHVIDNLETIEEEKKLIFILNKSDAEIHHLADIVRLVCKSACEVIITERETGGAACSALLAIEFIDSDFPLIISNSDQIITTSLNSILTQFQDMGAEAGVVTFSSVHPHWSFCRTDSENQVVETSEKKPISRSAIAGLYYFRNGSLFVSGAMDTIRKDANIQGKFFISPVFNELILGGRKVIAVPIPSESYHSFYSPSKIEEFEKRSILC